MIILGGTYKEINEFSEVEVIYGSGVRALETILELDNDISIDFYTCCRAFARKVQMRYASNKDLNWYITHSDDVSFNYIHPFNLSVYKSKTRLFRTKSEGVKCRR